jgi:DNA-binding MarR family transcriptional regulator
MFNTLKPTPEHIEALLSCLSDRQQKSPTDIAKQSGLTLTAVNGAVSQLEQENLVIVHRQNKTPKVLVSIV